MIIFIIIIIIALNWYFRVAVDLAKLLTKGVLIWCMVVVTVASSVIFISSVCGATKEVYESSVPQRINNLQQRYDAGEYGELRETLMLYRCFEEEFVPYWEIAESQQCYHEYLVYKTASLQNKEMADVYNDMMQKKQQRLQELSETGQAEWNKELLTHYAQLAQ